MKEEVEELFRKLNKDLAILGLEMDNHCDFVSILKDINSNQVVAVLADNNDIEWIHN